LVERREVGFLDGGRHGAPVRHPDAVEVADACYWEPRPVALQRRTALGQWYDAARPPGSISRGAERLKIMDEDGVAAEMLYPRSAPQRPARRWVGRSRFLWTLDRKELNGVREHDDDAASG
jgi:hypothetical protein